MSRTGTGALIALNGIGRQDEILYNLDKYVPEESPFRSKFQSFSHYTKFYRTYVREPESASTTWPFDSKIGFIIDPRISGDLLTNMFLKLSLPAITNGTWTDKMGRAIIESVEFRVDSTIVERLTDLDLVFKDELFTSERDNAIRNYTQNGNLYTNSLREEDYLTNPPVLPISLDHNQGALDLYVNLNMCFSHNNSYRPHAFPLASVFRQNVYVDIQFRNKGWFTDTGDDVYAPRVRLVTEQITVTDQERLYLQRNPFTIRYKTVNPLLIQPTDKNADTFSQAQGTTGSVDKLTIQIKNSKSTCLLGWFFRNRRFTNKNHNDEINSKLFLNRFNFSSHENFSNINPLADGYIEPYYGFNEKNFPICSQIEIITPNKDIKLLYSGGETEIIPSTSTFFRDITSQVKGIYRPNKNIFTYSFEEEPLSPSVSGSVVEDTNNYKITNILINSDAVKSNVYDVHVVAITYMDLYFENGIIKKI